MSHRIQRAVMMGLLMLAGVGTSACLPPLGTACGDIWCPDGYLCTSVDYVCVKSGCGNAIVEVDADEECDDGNLADEDSCLSTCQLNTCGDGKVNPQVEACDDGNLDDEDSCLSTCQLNTCGDSKVNPQAEACDDGNNINDDDCKNNCTVNLASLVKASNAELFNYFGHSVALSADGATLAVGAWGEESAATGIDGNQDDNNDVESGAVYVFTRSGTKWIQQAYIKASNTGLVDRFGWSVALSADGSTLAVGASEEDSAAAGIGGDQSDNSAGYSGAVYVFTRSGTTWSQQAYVKASNTDAEDFFGTSVALSADGSTLAVGALGEDSTATGIGGNQADNNAKNAGAVYVFTRISTTWSQQAYIKASNAGHWDYFGNSVSLSADGSTLAVGAVWEDSRDTGINGPQSDSTYADASGAVYVFTRGGTTWSQQAFIKATSIDMQDYFGTSVGLSADGSTLAVGARGEDSAAIGIGSDQSNSAEDSGAVFVFTRSSTTWSQQAHIKASNTGQWDSFGTSVALSEDGSTLAVGAHLEDSEATGIDGDQADDSAVDSGAVYVFTRSSTTWSQQSYIKASSIGVGDTFGTSVALSANGSTLAIGADESAEDAIGAVYVYFCLPGSC